MRKLFRLPGLAFRILLLLSSLAGYGCQLTGHCHGPKPATDSVPQTVNVTGDVRVPKTLDIGDLGLSLRTALEMAGGPVSPDGSASVPTDARMGMYVAVQRGGHGLASIATYFPLQLVTQGLAGEVDLTPGDVVRVGDFAVTSLNPEVVQNSNVLRAGNGSQFQVDGFVQNPSIFTITPGQSSTLGDFYRSDLSGAKKASDTANQALSTLVHIVRKAPTGVGTEQFLVPLNLISDSTALLSNSRIASGDRLTFTRPELVPIILSGLTAPLARQRLSDQISQLAGNAAIPPAVKTSMLTAASKQCNDAFGGIGLADFQQECLKQSGIQPKQ